MAEFKNKISKCRSLKMTRRNDVWQSSVILVYLLSGSSTIRVHILIRSFPCLNITSFANITWSPEARPSAIFLYVLSYFLYRRHGCRHHVCLDVITVASRHPKRDGLLMLLKLQNARSNNKDKLNNNSKDARVKLLKSFKLEF